MTVKRILIDGDWRDGAGDIDVRSPYSGERLATVASAGADELEAALAAAHKAARAMRGLARFQIARGLRRIADGVESRKEVFARTIALESAKPIKLARGETERAIATFEYAAGEAERFVGEVVAIDTQPGGRGRTGRTEWVPRGVIYGITPFNFPLNLVAHKVAPALASGNAIVIKPSPRTPLTALLLGEVFLESGLPPAALQVVPMPVELIERVIDDERVAMISFTGSAEVGWKLKKAASAKAVALELGGNAPVIVDRSADVEASVSKCVTGAFAYSGQVCISVQRIYVDGSLFDDWTERFVDGARRLRSGDPLDESTQISSMIDEAAAQRAGSWIKEAADNGARVMCGGERSGSFLEPTVLTGTHSEMRVVSEEVFAPVAVVEPFETFADALREANNSRYGLQAGVFTSDIANANLAARELEFGGVIINDIPTFRVDNMPYGGVKGSGFGREGLRYAMEEMCERRLIVSDL
ncbi:MAG: aldehyde dehydrogenase family protein [Pyrinomonadaceae bacterium]